MIAGVPQDSNAALIRQGQMSVIQKYIDSGDIRIVADQAANYWNPNEACYIQIYTEQALTANNNMWMSCLLLNDGCAGVAIEALKE